MTSDRARKRAARERAASTGERYVVARRRSSRAPDSGFRDIESDRDLSTWAPNRIVRVLHDLTHRVPGVPRHLDPDPRAVAADHAARHGARATKVRAQHRARAASAAARHQS